MPAVLASFMSTLPVLNEEEAADRLRASVHQSFQTAVDVRACEEQLRDADQAYGIAKRDMEESLLRLQNAYAKQRSAGELYQAAFNEHCRRTRFMLAVEAAYRLKDMNDNQERIQRHLLLEQREIESIMGNFLPGQHR
mmetsp:Transcript_2507/g.5149  ORF Transcript_2507/g.5149 Transcript_2507/m.5149 type:complete len:138 (-) Transcript_2507:258-671(-)